MFSAVKHRFCSDIGKSHLFRPFITNKRADVFNNVSFFLPVSYSLIARLHFFSMADGHLFFRDVTHEQWLRGKNGQLSSLSCDWCLWHITHLSITALPNAVSARCGRGREGGRAGQIIYDWGWILWTWAWRQSEQVMWRTLRISSSSMDNRHFRTEWKFNLTN